MRPLVLPSPLPAQPDIFDPAADDFLLLIQDQGSLMSTAQAALDSFVNQATDPANDIGGDLDAIGACWDGVDQTFGKLNDSLADLDYTQIISQVAAIENVFEGGVFGWALDISVIALPFLDDLAGFLDGYLSPLYYSVNDAYNVAQEAWDYANQALAIADSLQGFVGLL